MPAFHNVRCIVTATGSYGIKRGAHLRLWFLLDRPLTCTEKRRWLKPLFAKPVKIIDPSLYTPNQAIYTSGPVFEDIDDDPLFDMPRLIVLEGEDER